MGVISIGKKVLGTNAGAIDLIMNYCIREVGEKPYMTDAKHAFDVGYRHFALEDYPREDVLEFYNLLARFMANRELDKTLVSEHWKYEIGLLIRQLLTSIEDYALEEWGENIRT